MTAFSLVRAGTGADSVEPDQVDVTLHDSLFPARIRFEHPLNDKDFLAFCEANETLDIERDADGSISVNIPAGPETSHLIQILAAELFLWAEQIRNGVVCGPNLGVRFSDGALRAPDASWLSNERLKTGEGAREEAEGVSAHLS